MSSKPSTPPLLAVLEAARQRESMKIARASFSYMKHLHNKKVTTPNSSGSTQTVPSVTDVLITGSVAASANTGGSGPSRLPLAI